MEAYLTNCEGFRTIILSNIESIKPVDSLYFVKFLFEIHLPSISIKKQLDAEISDFKTLIEGLETIQNNHAGIANFQHNDSMLNISIHCIKSGSTTIKIDFHENIYSDEYHLQAELTTDYDWLMRFKKDLRTIIENTSKME